MCVDWCLLFVVCCLVGCHWLCVSCCLVIIVCCVCSLLVVRGVCCLLCVAWCLLFGARPGVIVVCCAISSVSLRLFVVCSCLVRVVCSDCVLRVGCCVGVCCLLFVV